MAGHVVKLRIDGAEVCDRLHSIVHHLRGLMELIPPSRLPEARGHVDEIMSELRETFTTTPPPPPAHPKRRH